MFALRSNLPRFSASPATWQRLAWTAASVDNEGVGVITKLLEPHESPRQQQRSAMPGSQFRFDDHQGTILQWEKVIGGPILSSESEWPSMATAGSSEFATATGFSYNAELPFERPSGSATISSRYKGGPKQELSATDDALADATTQTSPSSSQVSAGVAGVYTADDDVFTESMPRSSQHAASERASGSATIASRYKGGPKQELSATDDALADATTPDDTSSTPKSNEDTATRQEGEDLTSPDAAEDELQELNKRRAQEYKHHMPKFHHPGPTSESPLGSVEKEPPSSSFPA